MAVKLNNFPFDPCLEALAKNLNANITLRLRMQNFRLAILHIARGSQHAQQNAKLGKCA